MFVMFVLLPIMNSIMVHIFLKLKKKFNANFDSFIIEKYKTINYVIDSF